MSLYPIALSNRVLRAITYALAEKSELNAGPEATPAKARESPREYLGSLYEILMRTSPRFR